MTQDTISYADWLEKYKPVKNHIDSSASYEGMMFETYGAELAFVQSKKDEWLVWTLVTDDDGEDVIVSGYHYVNRMGYFVCQEPINPKIDVLVDEDA